MHSNGSAQYLMAGSFDHYIIADPIKSIEVKQIEITS
jgi:hypothetical protein